VGCGSTSTRPPRTATPGSASNSTASFIRNITPIHPTENALRTSRARRGLLAWTLAARASMLSPQTWHHLVQRVSSSSPYIAWLSVHPCCRGLKLQRLPARTRTECGGRAKVSNELSNYCGADPQPPLDDPGRFGAPGIGIDDHLACFTPKQSETHAWSLRMPCRRLLRTKPGNADHFQLLALQSNC
jgi:hypothetical protein